MRFPFLALALLLASLPFAGAEPPRPNIVLIMADDLGFADLGCYGAEIDTPHLDSLARDGLRFSQFYNTAKCHSSRVSLLTGLYCDQAGSTELSRGATIAEVLSAAGYHTMMVGKWHLSREPTDFGFRRYFGHLSGATNFFTGDKTFRLDGEPFPVPATLNGKPFYTTTAFTDYALEFLADHRKANAEAGTDAPFLLYLAHNAPHYPLHAPEEAVKKYDGRYDAGWDLLREKRHRKQLDGKLLEEKWKLAPRPAHVPAWDSLSAEEKQWEADRMEVFAAMVDVIDQNTGRLLEDLRSNGELDNTLILFCSDNGACPFERTRGRQLPPWDPKSYWTYDVGWAHVGNTPFRLYKQNQHEGGISSPLIAHWPAGLAKEAAAFRTTPHGPVTDQPAHLIDFMATCLELGRADYPESVGNRKVDPLQGKSLLPILQGRTRAGHEMLYFHFSTDRALRLGPWKAVSAKRGKWELYNLDQDRTELHDLAEEHPARLKKMIARWHEHAEKVDRLRKSQLAPARDTRTPLGFGKRRDPGTKTRKKRTKKEA